MKDAEEQRGGSGPSGGKAKSSPAATLLAALARVEEPERYGLLAEVLSELAQQSRAGIGVQAAGSAAEIEALSKKLQIISEEKAKIMTPQP